jgi:hypothetical protein
VWSLARDEQKNWTVTELGNFDKRISAMGENAAGEIFVLDYKQGELYRLHAP